MATVVTSQSSSQSAIASRSTVHVPQRRTGWASRSGGTATQCSAAPTSTAAAWGLTTCHEVERTGGSGWGQWSLRGGIRPSTLGGSGKGPTVKRPQAREQRGYRSLPNGIRAEPVTSEVVARSRDQPHIRARSTNDQTVTTTRGLPGRLPQRARRWPSSFHMCGGAAAETPNIALLGQNGTGSNSCTKPLRGSFLAAILCPVISGDVLSSPWMDC